MALTTFTSGQILTAAQMNAVQANDYNQTVSTKTASYTLVAADKGTRVVMNSASATTITVNTSLFSAGDTLVLQNISTGVCTVTAGTATVATAGSLAIPQNGSGILYFTSAGVSIFYPSAATSASGLTFITGASFTTVTSVSLPTNTFTSTYRNYRIIFDITGCTSTATITGRVRISGTDQTGSTYYQGSPGLDSAGNTNNLNNNASTSFALGAVETNGYLSLILDAVDPQINRNAHTFTGNSMLADGAAPAGNKGRSINLNYSTGSSTQIDSFSFISSIASSISGVYRIYAYSES